MTKNIDKRIIAEGFHTGYEVDYVTIPEHDYEYLKEQDERVQELEKDCDYISHQYGLEVEQNKRYRETIEFAINHLWLVKEIGQVDMVINLMRHILEGEK